MQLILLTLLRGGTTGPISVSSRAHSTTAKMVRMLTLPDLAWEILATAADLATASEHRCVKGERSSEVLALLGIGRALRMNKAQTHQSEECRRTFCFELIHFVIL